MRTEGGDALHGGHAAGPVRDVLEHFTGPPSQATELIDFVASSGLARSSSPSRPARRAARPETPRSAMMCSRATPAAISTPCCRSLFCSIGLVRTSPKLREWVSISWIAPCQIRSTSAADIAHVRGKACRADPDVPILPAPLTSKSETTVQVVPNQTVTTHRQPPRWVQIRPSRWYPTKLSQTVAGRSVSACGSSYLSVRNIRYHTCIPG